MALYGRLDLLVCNACPPPVRLVLENNAFMRIRDYVMRAGDLVLGPLFAFLPLLNESIGSAVVVSSIAAERPVREWPHYVAAKRLAESLAEVAVLQYPCVSILVARPEKLLTGMTNTPMGRRNAMRSEEMASRIVARLRERLRPGTCEVLH